MKQIFKWLIDKWLAGFITASIFFLLKLYIDLPESSKGNFLNFNRITTVLNTKIDLYKVLLVIFGIIVITRIEKANFKSKVTGVKEKTSKPPKNQFENYTKDVFGVNDSTWIWQYEWNSYRQQYEIVQLSPICKQCGTAMEVHSYLYGTASCHRCKLEGRKYNFPLTEQTPDVEKEIIRRVKNNEMPRSA